jgi:hypothetical protein
MAVIYSAFVLLMEFFNNRDTFWERMLNNTWLIIYVSVFNYILFEYTIPFIKPTWKRLLVVPFLIFIHMMFYSFGLFGWRSMLVQLHLYIPIGHFKSMLDGVEFLTAYSMGSVFIFGIIRHGYNYIKLKQATQQLRIEKQQAELNFLKSQTNPHFLFNTLNNIYSLARDKSDLAPESILRLSKILRYMLYETGGEYTAIEQELKIINDYIELEKLRYDETLRISFNHDIEDTKQSIPPLLLIPLIENAFKHGVSETRTNPFVYIHLSVKNRILYYQVKNSTDASGNEKIIKENIGLKNLRRQLELLYTDYSLEVQPGEADFTSVLKINLASHV